MSMYTAKQIKNHNSDTITKYGEWIPVRPINYKYETLRTKLYHAWMVIRGKYDVLYWEDDIL